MRPPSGSRLRRHLADTLDLTLWCLGCDVRHPEGNLLLARGLTRVRPPAHVRGATMYAGVPVGGGAGPAGAEPGAEPAEDVRPHFAAWGFGLFVGAPRHGVGLLLRRYDPAGARLTACAALPRPLWTPDALPDGAPVAGPAEAARAAALLRLLARQVAAHERWVAARLGADYRAACAEARPRHVRRHRRGDAAALAAAWDAGAAGYAAAARAMAAAPARRAARRARLAA